MEAFRLEVYGRNVSIIARSFSYGIWNSKIEVIQDVVSPIVLVNNSIV